MATVAARCGNQISLLCRDQAQMEAINSTGRNPRYLSEFELPKSVSAVMNLEEAIKDTAFIMLCIPAQVIPNWLETNKDTTSPEVVFTFVKSILVYLLTFSLSYLQTRQRSRYRLQIF